MRRHGMLTDEELAAILRASGRRVTAPRLLVYRLLQQSGGHATAERLLNLAAQRGERVTLPSIYAALGTLVGLGLAGVTHVLPGGAAIYDARPDRHHHVVCRVCGRIEDIECVVGEEALCLRPGDVQNFTVELTEVTHLGICSSCGLLSA